MPFDFLSGGFDAAGLADKSLPGLSGLSAETVQPMMCCCALCGQDSALPASTAFGPYRGDAFSTGATTAGVWTPDPRDAGAPGQAVMLNDINPGAPVEFTGNQNIDATLFGSKWSLTNITYSFPSSGTFYDQDPGTAGVQYVDGEAAAGNFIQFNAAQQAAARYAFNLVDQYTALTFTEITETATTHATIRIAQTNLSSVGSAYGNFPGVQYFAGDSWFGTTGQPFYSTPAVGNWGQATIMHEIGHTMGLKHGHQNYATFDLTNDGGYNYFAGLLPDASGRFGTIALTAANNGQSWTLMSYDAAPGFSGGFYGEGFNQPQTFGMFDIAALQFMYGADYTTNATDTTYTFDATTGQMFVNGVGQAAPADNTVLRTIWDGNGVDTLDLSNYTDNQVISLVPGTHSTFSQAQLADHNARNGGGAPAAGNIALALLHNNDQRSLIENATGGTGRDTITGNIGNNILYGGSEAATVVYTGPGTLSDPGGSNNSAGAALSLNNLFGQAADPDIQDATTAPHVSISATATGTGMEWYSFTVVNGGTRFVFDIDYGETGGAGSFDSYIRLYASNGTTQLAFSDDSFSTSGGGGSTSDLDSYLDYTIATPGTYYIAVDEFGAGTGGPLAGSTFELQVSAYGAVISPGTPGPAGGDTLYGGDGNDRLYGEGGNDSLYGGTGSDILDGGAGADRMEGGLGNDRYVVALAGDVIAGEVAFSSGGGIDTVESYITWTLGTNLEVLRLQGSANIDGFGNAAPESLVGNPGSNTMGAGGGNDIINAKAGNDTLIGGTGQDTMVGDTGADVFVYNSFADSYAGTATRDLLNGFTHGQDRIDLSAIDANPFNAGDQAFTFIGSAAFTGAGSNSAGQLRYFTFGGGNLNILEADWNGDGTPELQIFILGTNYMTGTDFIL